MLILITGSPASGKSSISCQLAKSTNSVIIPQDAFYNGKFELFPYDKDHEGYFERYDIYDWKKLVSVVKRTQNTVNIIVEGHCILTCLELVSMADFVFNLTIDKPICKKRFISRYSDNYTLEQLEAKETYFEKFIWPIAEQYNNECVRKYDNVFHIEGSIKNTTKIIDIIKNY